MKHHPKDFKEGRHVGWPMGAKLAGVRTVLSFFSVLRMAREIGHDVSNRNMQ